MAAIGWRVLVTSALGLVIALIARLLADVTMGIILALVVAAPLVPTVERLRRRGLSRSLASAVACVAGLTGLIVVVALDAPEAAAPSDAGPGLPAGRQQPSPGT